MSEKKNQKFKLDLKTILTLIVLAVAHKEFLAMDISQFKKTQSIVFDIKSALPREIVDARL